MAAEQKVVWHLFTDAIDNWTSLIEMLSTNLILRIYLMLFAVIFASNLFGISDAAITCATGGRINVDANDEARIGQAIKIKLMMLSERENGTGRLVRLDAMTVRLTVGLMYESMGRVKLNHTEHSCAIELWVMPLLNANKFQMKCDDDKLREYHLIDGGLREMSAEEMSEFSEKLAKALYQHEFPADVGPFILRPHRIVSAQRIAVNGFIDLARVELHSTANNETIQCAVETWGSSLLFRDLNIACDKHIYKLISNGAASAGTACLEVAWLQPG